MALHRFFKPAEVNCQLNPAPVRDADEAVELRLNTKPKDRPGYLALFDMLIPRRRKLPILVDTRGNL